MEARRARQRGHILFFLSLTCGVGAGVWTAASGKAGEMPGPPAVVLLAVGVVLGCLAGPRVWPAFLVMGFVSSILVLVDGGALLLLCSAVLVLGYGGRIAFSLIRHHRLWAPLEPEPDRPRASGSTSAGPGARAVRDATVASSAPSDRGLRKRWR